MGAKPTEFVRVTPRRGDVDVAFENRAHDWPKLITYRRTATGVAVRIEGAPGARVEEYELEPVLISARP